eukprot:403499-Rhodomonas_salina.1
MGSSRRCYNLQKKRGPTGTRRVCTPPRRCVSGHSGSVGYPGPGTSTSGTRWYPGLGGRTLRKRRVGTRARAAVRGAPEMRAAGPSCFPQRAAVERAVEGPLLTEGR